MGTLQGKTLATLIMSTKGNHLRCRKAHHFQTHRIHIVKRRMEHLAGTLQGKLLVTLIMSMKGNHLTLSKSAPFPNTSDSYRRKANGTFSGNTSGETFGNFDHEHERESSNVVEKRTISKHIGFIS